MAYDEELAERVRAALDDVKCVAEIKMVGVCVRVGRPWGGVRILAPADGVEAQEAEDIVALKRTGDRRSGDRPHRPASVGSSTRLL